MRKRDCWGSGSWAGAEGDTEGFQQLWNSSGVGTVVSRGPFSMTLYHRGVIQQLSRNARI